MKNDAETQQLIEALASAMPDLDETQQHLAVTLYRTLAEGRPVELSRLATRAGLGESLVRETVESWTGVFRDDEGRIVGFWGLALPEMAHRLEVDGVGIYTWCAYDPLFIVPLLGTPGRVESNDPVTGETVSLTVTPEGVEEVSPPGAEVSFLTPDEPWGHDVIQTFCHYVHFFASKDSGHQWVEQHAGTRLFSVEEAFEIGRGTNQHTFGAALVLTEKETENDSTHRPHEAVRA